MDILKRLDSLSRSEANREYIGASGVGHPCLRKIWYEYHKPELASSVDARTLRIFRVGDKVEELVIELLIQAGIEVLRPSTTFSDKELPYLQGHIDGILPHENMILEIKSCKDSSFKIFKNKGLSAWFPAYYTQVQCYMAFTNLPKALVIGFNKDNAELHAEIIEFNKEAYESAKNKAKAIYLATQEPPRLSNNPAWFQCKLCSFHKYCHNLGEV